jgi:hypothetical protein
MAVQASSLLSQAGILLQDTAHTRWPLPELASWIDDGIRAIVMAKPGAAPLDIVLTLVPGTLQKLPQPTTGNIPQSLLSLTRNLRQTTPARLSGRAISATNRLSLDGRSPNWHDERVVPLAKEVRQFFADTLDPLRFWVYPGNDGTGVVEAIVSALPQPITPTGNANLEASYNFPIPLVQDIYATPLLDYICFRAQSKDDTGANAGRAAAHYSAFATALGIKVQAEAGSQPGRRVSG